MVHSIKQAKETLLQWMINEGTEINSAFMFGLIGGCLDTASDLVDDQELLEGAKRARMYIIAYDQLREEKATEKAPLIGQILPLKRKHIFTKTLGDGHIEKVTLHNDLKGCWVFFFTNDDGGYQIRLDGKEFLEELDEVRDLTWGDAK
jgi:hypothetical protein